MRNTFDLIYLIPLLPLIGFLINGLARNVLLKSLVSIIGSGVIFLSFLLSVVVFLNVRHEGFIPQVISYFDFINVGKIHVSFAFQVDQLSSLFLLIERELFLVKREPTQAGSWRCFEGGQKIVRYRNHCFRPAANR